MTCEDSDQPLHLHSVLSLHEALGPWPPNEYIAKAVIRLRLISGSESSVSCRFDHVLHVSCVKTTLCLMSR